MQRENRGQIVLILVLLTVVGLTIGLSLISRTITDVRITSQIEQSSRAFSAAEAGIETALGGNVAIGPTGTVNLPGASANYSVKTIGGSSDPLVMPLTVPGDTQHVWLLDHNPDDSLNEAGYAYPAGSNLEICWGSQSTGAAAVLITLFYKDAGSYKVAKKAYDPENRGNNFIPAEILGGYCQGDYSYRIVIVAGSDIDPATDDFGLPADALMLLMRLQPLYAPTSFAVDPAQNLPLQGKIITSIGQTNTNIVRKIQVYQGFPVLPTLLDFSFFSEN